MKIRTGIYISSELMLELQVYISSKKLEAYKNYIHKSDKSPCLYKKYKWTKSEFIGKAIENLLEKGFYE